MFFTLIFGDNFFFSPQLSMLTGFAKIKNKKVITENQCEKDKTRGPEFLYRICDRRC